MTIKINLLRKQHFATTEAERKIIQAMLENAYRIGISVGEDRVITAMNKRLQEAEEQFLYGRCRNCG